MDEHWVSTLTENNLDAFKEITNIGAGNAATSLAAILSDRVLMSVPKLEILDVGQLTEILGGPEMQVTGVLIRFYEDIDGMIMFIMEKQLCHLLLSHLLEKNMTSFHEIDDMDMSVFQEIGNMIVGGYINALSDMLDMKIMISAPDIAIDMVGAILSYPAQLFGQNGDKVLFVREDFETKVSTIRSHLLIMPQPESFDKIIDKLTVLYGG
jgi:chemotaxis protein CheC